MKPYIQISIRTNIETVDWDVGSRLLESLYSNEGLLSPEFVSHNVDKVKEPFEGGAQAELFWAEKASIRANGSLSDFFLDFAWRRKRSVKSSGNVIHTFRNIRNKIVPGSARLNSVFSDKIDWYQLFKTWSEIFPPQLGMLHYFTEPELGPHEVHNSFQIGSFKAALKPEVPDSGWAMFYGDEFAEKVDADRIASAGFPIEKIGDGYLVRVTNDIQDIVADFQLFAQRRVELKSLFPEGFFLA
ncbi:hypothetical protein [Achromobacter denitrificans]|uniref:Uncharacterized protein n=2 Tax=Achromobacter denitrificans TaxID=32002 RepID=A0ABZ3GEL3_ACHDE|nr:hypothetical protein [Achromobacter denitrificans]MDF3848008.1 hypothetical protein [Achromobacter denitrificans]OLT99350.1 hypothetical protein BVK87_30535 [Achromobacter denitrificans]QKH42064.1 hypothetical protein FOC82_11525 [Achromobacter denitrificans]QKH50792.1 hypothetical protein FOC80_15625 [Achromobacter denitrificans]CAB3744430.1 hypothetical protein LMG1231_06068 [Achromobacter denitrificans]